MNRELILTKLKPLLNGCLEKDVENFDINLEDVVLVFDSTLDHIELVFEIESDFNITINDEEAENWKTVKDVVDSVDKLIA